MPSITVGTRWTSCTPGMWVSLWDSPTWGFTYVWADRPVTIQWRRFSSGLPFYMAGSANLHAGQNTIIHGGPSLYMRLEVNPAAPALLRAT